MGPQSLAALLVFALVACSVTPPHVQYLADHVNRAAQDEIEKRMGAPALTRALENGDTLWTYQYGAYGTTAVYGTSASYAEGSVLIGSAECVKYVLTFDKQNILREWMRQEC
jgi:hypothetical protein